MGFGGIFERFSIGTHTTHVEATEPAVLTPPTSAETAGAEHPSDCRFALACGAACVLVEAANETAVWRARSIPGVKTSQQMDYQAWSAIGRVVSRLPKVGEYPCIGCKLNVAQSPLRQLLGRSRPPWTAKA